MTAVLQQQQQPISYKIPQLGVVSQEQVALSERSSLSPRPSSPPSW